jgi:hypothetical protein
MFVLIGNNKKLEMNVMGQKILPLVLKTLHILFVLSLTGLTLFSNNRFVLYGCIITVSLLYLQWHIFGECLLTRFERDDEQQEQNGNQASFMIQTLGYYVGPSFANNLFTFTPILFVCIACYKLELLISSLLKGGTMV